LSPRRRSRVFTVAAALAALVAAPPARGQESEDFFGQKEDYFRTETIEGVSKHAESLADAPATVTVLTHDDIERYGLRTIADVLSFASLGNMSYSDRRYDFAGGRGLFFFEDYNTRILVMLNGHPLNEPWNNFGGIGREMVVPLDLAERVEIIYGPSSLLYGGYSLYGIVNVVTQNGESAAGSRVRASAGSWETGEVLVSHGRSGSSRGTPWNVLFAAGYYRSRGEALDLDPIDVEYPAQPNGDPVWGGPQSGTDAERSPFAFVYAKRGELSLLLRSGFRKHGAPLAPYESIYGSTRELVRDTKHFGEIRWDRALSARLGLSLRAFHDDYTYEEHDPYFDPDTYPGQETYDFVLKTHDWDSGAEARVRYEGPRHALTVGGEYRHRGMNQQVYDRFVDGSVAPDSFTETPVDGHLAVGYLQEEWRPLERVRLVGGLNIADTSPGGRRVQPRAAVIVKPRAALSLKLLYNEGFRPPSIFEASYGDFVTQIANPALRSERIRSGELSLLWKPSPRLSAQGYAFTSRLLGLIRNNEIGSPEDVESGIVAPSGDPAELVGLFQYQAAGDVRSSGAGLALQARARRGVRGYLNVACSRARIVRAGEPDGTLAGSSSWLASGGLSGEVGRATVSASARYVGPHDLEETHADGSRAGDFLEANLRLSVRARLRYPVRLDLDVRNLFDAAGAQASSFIYTPARVPIEGRRLLVAADVKF
jgi:iron complex outermembrane receptor protein